MPGFVCARSDHFCRKGSFGMKLCSVDGCGGGYFAKCLCRKHWTKEWKQMSASISCSVEGCDKRHHSKGFCEKHYKIANKERDNARRRKGRTPSTKICSIDGCGGKHKAKGLCLMHYKTLLDREYRAKNAESIKAKRKESNAKRVLEIRDRRRELYRANPSEQAARSRKYDAKHPEIKTISTAKRRATKLNATPKWANKFFIQEAYRMSRLRTKMLGIKHEVDHKVPLQHPLVCGLHVEQNLQVIPMVHNRSKGNRIWPNMPT